MNKKTAPHAKNVLVNDIVCNVFAFGFKRAAAGESAPVAKSQGY
jgi:hypothetical protein